MKLYCDKCKEPFPADVQPGSGTVPCPVCGAEITVPEKSVAPGVVIGDFLVEKPLSSGGMGEVFIARQLSLDRPVALKVLRDKFNGDKEYIDGLFREARAAAKITHPNIVQAYAVGEENGVYYFAMELIRGETFKQILKRENVLDFTKAAKVIREVASALDVAWRDQKLVHQDIKPDNIMLDANGFAKLADLGLARSASNNENENNDADEVLGTPQYISPEQLTGVPTDVRSDIYSLGATFYQFVTGRFPYVADTAEEMSKMHVEGNLTPPVEVNPQLPEKLNNIIVKMMARNIDQRYQLPSELISDLDDFLADPSKASAGRPALQRPGLGGALKKPLAAPGAKPAVPGVRPLIGKPAVPGAKPGLTGAKPLIGKPAVTGAKPAVPGAKPLIGKPAVPGAKPPAAKPAVQEKPQEQPAVPAAEAAKPAVEPEKENPAENVPAAAEKVEAPAAEAAPANAAAPQEENVKTPEKKDGDEITLAPETPRRAKKVQPEAEGKEADDGEKKGKTEKERFDRNAGRKSGGILKAVLLLLILLLISGGGGAGFYFAARADKLPAKLKPWGEKLLAKLGHKKAETPAAAQEKKSEPAKPAEPAKPQTRKEYVDTLESLRSEYRNTAPAKRGAWLEKADKILYSISKPVTPEELEVLTRTWEMYSTADENLRFSSARREAHRRHDAAVEARRAAVEKEQQEKIRRQEAEAQRQQQFAEQNEEMLREQKKREAEIKIRLNKLQADFTALSVPVVKAVISAGESGDTAALDAALQAAEDYLVPTVCDTREERAAIGVFNILKKNARRAASSYRRFVEAGEKFRSSVLIMVRRDGRNVLVRIDGIKADGAVICRTTSGEKFEYRPETAAARRQLENYLLKNCRIPHVVFYYNLLNRTLTPASVKNAPDVFWKTVLQYYGKALAR